MLLYLPPVITFSLRPFGELFAPARSIQRSQRRAPQALLKIATKLTTSTAARLPRAQDL